MQSARLEPLPLWLCVGLILLITCLPLSFGPAWGTFRAKTHDSALMITPPRFYCNVMDKIDYDRKITRNFRL